MLISRLSWAFLRCLILFQFCKKLFGYVLCLNALFFIFMVPMIDFFYSLHQPIAVHCSTGPLIISTTKCTETGTILAYLYLAVQTGWYRIPSYYREPAYPLILHFHAVRLEYNTEVKDDAIIFFYNHIASQ